MLTKIVQLSVVSAGHSSQCTICMADDIQAGESEAVNIEYLQMLPFSHSRDQPMHLTASPSSLPSWSAITMMELHYFELIEL